MLAFLQKRLLCLSVSCRIIAITACSSFVALALLCAISLYRDTKVFSKSKVEDLDTLSQMLESNTQAALRFNDPYRAQEYVNSFRSVEDVLSVTLFDAEGRVFAQYNRDDSTPPAIAPDFTGAKHDTDRIWFARELNLDEEPVGKILIAFDTRSLSAANRQNILVYFSLFTCGLLIAVALAAWMQKSVTKPAKQLLEATSRVIATKDYTTKVEKVFNDEIGSLVDGFNAMLDTVRVQDEKLRKINSDLEQTVAERTQDLQARNEALIKAIEDAKAASIAKSEFLATTSHELRTPLNPIIGYVEMLLWRDPDREDCAELKLIKQSAEQLLSLIDDILDFSRIERGTLQLESNVVDLPTLCGDVRELMKQEAQRKGLQIQYRHQNASEGQDPSSTSIEIDERRLRQVLLNLVGNALKFTPKGSIKIESKLQRTAPGQAVLEIEVADSGIGISSENLSKLFKPFSQIDGSLTREYGGMGLGLAISKKIVEAMKGQITCQSVVDQGTTFSIEVPVRIIRQTDQSQTNAPPLQIPVPSGSAGILLVEDEAVNRELVRSLLASFGYKVTVAADGLEALEKWRDSRQNFDLVLLDISMPRLDGYATAIEIRKTEDESQRIPIIAMTAHARQSDRERCLEAGMDDYLSKPLSLTTLNKTLRKWLPQSHPNQSP